MWTGLPVVYFIRILINNKNNNDHHNSCKRNISFFNVYTLVFFFFLIFIYLALPGLSCGTWGLRSLLRQQDL